jgi:hypothetical protein
MSRDFQLRALLELDHKPTNYIDWLFVMQHYGLPTRLIDWTESCLVAIYFAVEDYEKKCNAVVWLLHPWQLNKLKSSFGQKSVPPVNKSIIEQYRFPNHTVSRSGHPVNVKKEFPMALRPSHSTRRIIAQRGQFTIHGKEQTGLEKIPNLNRTLQKIIINGNAKLNILRELYLSGISRYTLFPEIEGLSQEISIRYSNKFMGKT